MPAAFYQGVPLEAAASFPELRHIELRRVDLRRDALTTVIASLKLFSESPHTAHLRSIDIAFYITLTYSPSLTAGPMDPFDALADDLKALERVLLSIATQCTLRSVSYAFVQMPQPLGPRNPKSGRPAGPQIGIPHPPAASLPKMFEELQAQGVQVTRRSHDPRV